MSTPKAIREAEIQIGDVTIPCAVLDNEQRLLTQGGVLRAIGRSPNPPTKRGEPALDKLPAFLTASNLKSFISEDLVRSTKPVVFQTKRGGGAGGNKALGYPAEVLPAICRVFIDAQAAGALTSAQQHIAERCQQLLNGLSVVGIVALIDEATGYQAERDRDALHKILEAYINPELIPLPWTKRFPDEFYKQLFRLKDWQYSPPSVKRPKLLSNLTARLVYQQLPPGVWDQLRQINPTNPKGNRRYRHHQFLTENIGNPHLEKQLVAVTTLMRSASNWRNFERLFNRAFPPKQGEFSFNDGNEEPET